MHINDYYEQLSDNDNVAIGQLKRFVDECPDPNNRHFLYLFLEQRLYRHRDDRPGALEEFDAICERHHSEMAEIAPALIRSMIPHDGLPRLYHYQQQCIRQQKAGRWDQVVLWADRGLQLYRDFGDTTDSITDLEKRRARAMKKLGTQ